MQLLGARSRPSKFSPIAVLATIPPSIEIVLAGEPESSGAVAFRVISNGESADLPWESAVVSCFSVSPG
jgi:hypothetical protein